MTEPEPLQQVERTYVRFHGRKLSYFSGCDYFRLASHPKVIAALEHGLEKYGLNVAASRFTTGNHVLYEELEQELADFFGAEDALLVATGYATNQSVAQALAGQFSHALLDEHSHTALSDAARFLDCPLLRFQHRDSQDLGKAVRRCGPGAKLLLLTDGMFSQDGSAAPLDEYLKILPKDAQILVDDAHGAGVLGLTGKGAVEHAGVSRRRIIQTLTLSKAFGTYGGAILSTRAFRRQMLSRSRALIGSTPLPLPLAAAARQAVRILSTRPALRQRLRRNTRYIKEALCQAGFAGVSTAGPILLLTPEHPRAAARLNSALLEAGIFPPFIHYPTGPAQGFFRFAIASEHTRAQLDPLLEVLLREGFGSGFNPIATAPPRRTLRPT